MNSILIKCLPTSTSNCIAIVAIVLLLNFDRTSTQNIISANDVVTEEEFYSYFMRESPRYPAVYMSNITMDDIPWLDKRLMERAVRFYRKFRVPITISHFFSLLEAISFKTTTSVVISTGNFANTTMAYKRMLKTLYHVIKVCEGGLEVFVPNTEAYESLKIITRRHKASTYLAQNRSISEIERLTPLSHTKEGSALVHAIQADLNHVYTRDSLVNSYTWDTSTPVGQFDLGVGQFLYVAHLVMTPEYFGVYPSSQDDVIAFVHMWAVFGRLLGLEDRFNVALNLPLEEYRKFYYNTIIVSFKNMDERVLSLIANTMEGFYSGAPIPSMGKLKCFLYYFFTHTVENYVGSNMLQLMDIEDKVCLQLYALSTGPFNNLQIMSFLARIAFDSWFFGEFERLNIAA